jgi:uncharacterized membrane protein
MKLWRPQCKVEIQSGSGVFSVTLTPQLNAGIVVLTALFFCVVLIGWQRWPGFIQHQASSFFMLGFIVLGAIWYQIAGSEEIEVSRQRLIVRKNHPLWPKTWEAPLQECSRLATREPGGADSDTLTCRIRGKAVTFGAGLIPEQSDSILIELQRALPEASDWLLKSADDPFGKHLTTLKLS